MRDYHFVAFIRDTLYAQVSGIEHKCCVFLGHCGHLRIQTHKYRGKG